MKIRKIGRCITFSIMAVIVVVLVGCVRQNGGSLDESESVLERPEYEIEVLSAVKAKDCYICGNRDDSLMPYYAKRDSIGVVFWGEPAISDTEVRAYDDDGNELFGQNGSSTRISSFGENHGSIMVQGTPNRGFTNVDVNYEKNDEVDFNNIKKYLCQDCLNAVVGFYVDQKNYGEDNRLGTTGYCLVDFATKKLYTLSDPYSGYFIRDYYVSYNIVENADLEDSHIEVFILYAPERTAS